jgi:hypothetical protein
MTSKEDYLRMVQDEFNTVLDSYARMLRELRRTKDGAVAEELVDIALKRRINPLLYDLAQDVWISRKRGPLEALKSKHRVWLTDRLRNG